MKKHVFGPVPSRRLGISLGLDVVPYKYCTYDCIYCQLKNTTNNSLQRQNFFDYKQLIKEVKEVLLQNDDIDYMTFSGSGEPTLNLDIGKIATELKQLTNIKLALLTNGSLLWNSDVIKDIKNIDLIIPNLDAGIKTTWNKINRPNNILNFDKVINGLIEFTHTFTNDIYLEIMLVKNVNTNSEEILAMAEIINKFGKISKIQLNTVVRPPCETSAQPLTQLEMQNIADLLKSKQPFPVEVVAFFERKTNKAYHTNIEEAILETLERRSCKSEELAISLGLHVNEINKYLPQLLKEKKIYLDGEYYRKDK